MRRCLREVVQKPSMQPWLEKLKSYLFTKNGDYETLICYGYV